MAVLFLRIRHRAAALYFFCRVALFSFPFTRHSATLSLSHGDVFKTRKPISPFRGQTFFHGGSRPQRVD